MRAVARAIRNCPPPYEVAEGGHFVQEWGGRGARGTGGAVGGNRLESGRLASRTRTLSMFEQFRHREAYILGDLPQENWRDVAAGMERESGRATSAVAKLLVRTALPHLNKTRPSQDRCYFGGLENRNIAHDSGHGDVLHPDKFRFENRISVFEKHRNDLAKVGVQFVKGRALRVRSRKSRDETYEQPGFRVTLDYGGKGLHGCLRNLSRSLSDRFD